MSTSVSDPHPAKWKRAHRAVRASRPVCARSVAFTARIAAHGVRHARAAHPGAGQPGPGLVCQSHPRRARGQAHAALGQDHAELCRHAGARQPDCAGADRRLQAPAGQPRSAARRQFHRHGTGLAGCGAGRAGGGGHHALLRAKELGEVIEKAKPALALCDATLLEELQTAKRKAIPCPPSCPST
jgi:hypothetical protein